VEGWINEKLDALGVPKPERDVACARVKQWVKDRAEQKVKDELAAGSSDDKSEDITSQHFTF
jgi:hypothetical protein